MPPLTLIFHILALFLHLVTLSYVPTLTNPLQKGFGGPFKFLTIIGLSLSTFTFLFALLSSLVPPSRTQKASSTQTTLHNLKTTFSLLSTPLECLIGLFYWGLWFLDKKLVTPPGHEVPLLLNLGLHALPGVALVGEFLGGEGWDVSLGGAVAVGIGEALAYGVWSEVCRGRNGW